MTACRTSHPVASGGLAQSLYYGDGYCLLIDCVLIVRPSRLLVDAPVKRGETLVAPGNNHTTSRHFRGLSATSHRATTDIPWSVGEVGNRMTCQIPRCFVGLPGSAFSILNLIMCGAEAFKMEDALSHRPPAPTDTNYNDQDPEEFLDAF
ncbi:hypothetical protein B0H14DRAFT_3441507 [Mycena olivaceomarginata]|nr:hypothetical protein B0H14DRAFT_3441507 [Mycena olivaceomarginata]